MQQLTPTLQFYSSNPRNSAANIRGLGAPFGLTNDGIEQGVGIYVDDVYLNRPQGAVLDIYEVERIEVLRGPQGTLFGRNTIGGAVSVVTKKPGDKLAGNFDITTGSFNRVQVKGSVDVPLAEGVYTSFSGFYHKRDGYVKGVIPAAPDLGDTDQLAGRFALRLEPTSNLTIDVSVDGTRTLILAAILLKMGGYGFLRFSLPMFPEASQLFQPLMFALSVIAIVYASLVAFRQTDIKKLVAYSSVAHMGFVTLGIFAFNEIGIQGAIFQMISHGIISGALFFCVGVIYDRMHTRDIAFYGGLVHRMPVYAALFMLFSMANVGLPGTSGFVGEILTMVGGFQASTWAAAGAALGVIFSAVYMLTLYRRVVFGEMTNEKLFDIKDVTALEFFILGLLAISALAFGVFPGLIFDLTKGSTLEVLRMIGR